MGAAPRPRGQDWTNLRGPQRTTSRTDQIGRTSLVYDLAGQNTGRQNALGNWITMVYDLAGRQLAIFNEVGYAVTNSYDLNGRTVSIIDGTSRVKTMTWDNASNQTGTAYFDGTILTNVYDPLNRVTTMSDWTGITTYAFDPRSLLVGKTDPGPLVQVYEYDVDQNRTILVDPDGGVRTVTYDALNRISVYQNALGKPVTVLYDADSRPTTLHYDSGIIRVATFDAAGQTIGHVNTTAAGTMNSQFTFAYDPAGDRTLVQDLNGSWTTYQYDAKRRLVQDDTTGTNAHLYTYSFDPVDNRLSSSETGALTFWTFDAASRMVTAISGGATTTYNYSASGNLTGVSSSTGRITMSYDGENRLQVYESTGAPTTYAYSGDGLKRLEIAGSAITTLVWDGTDYLQAR